MLNIIGTGPTEMTRSFRRTYYQDVEIDRNQLRGADTDLQLTFPTGKIMGVKFVTNGIVLTAHVSIHIGSVVFLSEGQSYAITMYEPSNTREVRIGHLSFTFEVKSVPS